MYFLNNLLVIIRKFALKPCRVFDAYLKEVSSVEERCENGIDSKSLRAISGGNPQNPYFRSQWWSSNYSDFYVF